MSIIYIGVMISMNSLLDTIQLSIDMYQDQQGSHRKKINIEKFEQDIIKKIGSQEKYNLYGGYKEFHKYILYFESLGILKSVITCRESNSKKPALSKLWWIEPKYIYNQWSTDTIAKLSSLLDITFYIRNKKYQTIEELDKLEHLYSYIKNYLSQNILNREECSLIIFNGIANLSSNEPEKYLASSEGRTLLNRLNLTNKDLNYEIVREPFVFWINNKVSNDSRSEVLIIEGLATYHTLKKILQQELEWKLGPVPYILIWGAGRRIEGTIDYLHDIVQTPEKIIIRYAGDIDWEGFDIFHSLKNKNKNLDIVLATEFYDFLVCYGLHYAKKISTDQKRVDSILHSIQAEFVESSVTFSKLQHLWFNNMRLAQEFINLDTLTKEGWLRYV